jgi:hypothetical protein
VGGAQQVSAVRVQGVVELCADDVSSAISSSLSERRAGILQETPTRESTVENERVPVADRRNRTSTAEELA